MKHWLKAVTLAIALLVGVALPAQAKDRHGRKHRHGRRVFVTRTNSANPTPGVPRRVRRGRNLTPGTPRGPLVRRTTVRTVPINRGRGRNHELNDMIRHERDRDRDLGTAIGRGHGRGRKP